MSSSSASQLLLSLGSCSGIVRGGALLRIVLPAVGEPALELGHRAAYRARQVGQPVLPEEEEENDDDKDDLWGAEAENLHDA